jgi:putative ABC transport system ATP-binding protein
VLDLLGLVLSPDHAQRFDFSTAEGDFDVSALWRDAQQSKLARLRSQNLGYVLQSGGLLGYLDVRSNIELPRQLLGLKDDGSVRALAEQLEIADQLDKKPHQLSVGQRQRVSCARALANTPRLLLADEPTASLDPLNAGRVIRLLLERASDRNTCCVIATHDGALARDHELRTLKVNCQRDMDGGVTATLEQPR